MAIQNTHRQTAVIQVVPTRYDDFIILRKDAPRLIQAYDEVCKNLLAQELLYKVEEDAEDRGILRNWILKNKQYVQDNEQLYLRAKRLMLLSIEDVTSLQENINHVRHLNDPNRSI